MTIEITEEDRSRLFERGPLESFELTHLTLQMLLNGTGGETSLHSDRMVRFTRALHLVKAGKGGRWLVDFNAEEIETAMDMQQDLVAAARADTATTAAIQAMMDSLPAGVAALDSALAGLQSDPADVGSAIVRGLVLRGTLNNVVQTAIKDYQDKEAGHDDDA
jgi:hypothetical protein